MLRSVGLRYRSQIIFPSLMLTEVSKKEMLSQRSWHEQSHSQSSQANPQGVVWETVNLMVGLMALIFSINSWRPFVVPEKTMKMSSRNLLTG